MSFALYVWQFHFVSSEARSFLLAGLGQYPGLPLFSLACRLVIPFSNHSWGPPETLAANALSRPPLLKNAPARAVRPGLVL